MKRTVLFFLISFLIVSFAYAETDYSAMDIQQIDSKREELIVELSELHKERGKRIKESAWSDASGEVLGKIIDLFPDETLAKAVRDGCAKFSIDQTVTQADLDKVTKIWISNETIHQLTGIGLLRTIKQLILNGCYDGNGLPDEMRNCMQLEVLGVGSNENLSFIPAWIGDFQNLKTFDASFTGILSLPDSFGNLQSLTAIYLDYCESLSSLPETIGNCISLEELYISHTAIESLPDSIYNLSLEHLDMEGTNIR